MKQLEVHIMGQSYLLGVPQDGDARLLEAVAKVDQAMCQIRDSGKVKARDRIAVLAAINLAFDLQDTDKAPESEQREASHEKTPSAPPSARLQALLAQLDDVLSRDNQLI